MIRDRPDFFDRYDDHSYKSDDSVGNYLDELDNDELEAKYLSCKSKYEEMISLVQSQDDPRGIDTRGVDETRSSMVPPYSRLVRRPLPRYTSRRAYLNGQDYLGRTPLMMAMMCTHPSSVLIAYDMICMGARSDLVDAKGKSAYDYAKQSGDIDKIKMFE